MEKDSISNLHRKLTFLVEQGKVPKKVIDHLFPFLESYVKTVSSQNKTMEEYLPLFDKFLSLVAQQITTPYTFEPYHVRIRSPFDYYMFGLEFLKPLVDKKKSYVLGLEYADQITAQLKKGDNVILFANHQTEADPQAISILLEDTHPMLAEEIIMVAGHRVVTDPLAVPFSMGRNLLCVYSKRYIDFPPEEKLKKQLHNKKTMELMSSLLSEGGKCIYVAPSGGRDRPNEQNIVTVESFDPQSVEMFYLMAKKAKKTTHFYPFALATYDLLPPPEAIQVELGETRVIKGGAIHLVFGKEIDMETIPGTELSDKHERRKARADYIHSLVVKDYARIK